ncbi:cyclase family protein [Sphingomonas sp.]|uniref:cyclase family protein n=1 Tax=Sphingomonas sp. TaxID=28214 RepID=UPI00286C36F2|nr:cyclase family protein [Sphingomonas sp.]
MAHMGKERLVDLSHVIEEGMTTYKGLPGPHICDFWEREASAANYDDGSSFQIGRIDMVANTGTYLDSPFHRYAEGQDLSELALESLANLAGIVVRQPFEASLAVDAEAFAGLEVRGKAVLVATGWDRHWRTDAYLANSPFLTAAAAEWLVANGAALVGIDSHNIDDTNVRARPVHTILLGAGIPICEHMTQLGALPDSGFRFAAVPPKVKGMGTFPVRAYAVIDA